MSNLFGNLGELAKMMSKAKEIQAGLKTFREELPNMEFSASAPGGQVRVIVTGDFQIREIHLTDAALKERSLLEEQILETANSALTAARVAVQEKIRTLTGGLGVDMPGLF